jgi:hypothetical protein
MENKKAMENALLAVIGIGLITTAVVLLSTRKKETGKSQDEGQKRMAFEDYDDHPGDLRAFSETGIYL